jgi:subtilase family serine protease
VAGVQFRVDGANLGAEDTTSPYSVTWNTTTASNGSHTLTAVARDAAGNTTTSVAVTVTVNNAGPSPLPDVIVTSLSYASGVFTSTVKNQGTAATPAGKVIGVGYSVDGVPRTWGVVANPPLAAGQSATVDTNGGPYTIPTGTHTITAFVDDVNRFAESDETNNRLSRSITVP